MLLEGSSDPKSSLSDLYNTGNINVIAEEAFGLYWSSHSLCIHCCAFLLKKEKKFRNVEEIAPAICRNP